MAKRSMKQRNLFKWPVWLGITAIVLSLSASMVSAQIGYRDGFRESILMGHSFFRPASDEILELVGPTAHHRHSQIRHIAGGTNGDVGALWRDIPAGMGIKADIEAGGIELLGVAWSPDGPDNELADFAQWIDLALEHNSNTLGTVFIHSSWVPNSVFGTHVGARIAQNNWNQQIDDLVSQLRSAYPDLTILHMPAGEIMLRLWDLAEQGSLGPEIHGVMEQDNPEFFLQFDDTGHAGWIMVDAMGLMWHKVLYPDYDIRTIQDSSTFSFKKDWTYDISQLVHEIYEDFPLAQCYNDPPLAPSAPYFFDRPVVEVEVAENAAYPVATLADDAGDSDRDPLTFAKVSGPAWLSVATSGMLSGTPATEDVGLNTFTVSVSDGNFPAVEETLEIPVNSTGARSYSVADGSFENVITNESSAWNYMNAVWNDDADNEYEVRNADALDGDHKAYLFRISTIYQDLGTVYTGETVQVTYWTQGGTRAGDMHCEFLVDGVSQGIQTNTLDTVGNGEEWAERSHVVQITQEGTLRLKFFITGDTRCYMDHVSDVSVTPGSVGDTPPNVVVVYIDDLGWKDLSCYGSTFYETPVIDQLAADGTRFTDAYAACQICSPSRRALLTGKYPARSNFTDLPGRAAATGKKLIDPVQADVMPNAEVLFPEIFQAAGYHTGFIGKWHLEVADEGEMATQHGFDVWDEIDSEGSGDMVLVDDAGDPKEVSEITDKSIAFVQDAVTNGQPFMLYMSHRTVHVQLQTTPGLHAKYDAKSPGENGQDNPYMGGMVEDLDSELGRFLQTLETLGIADDTLIIFTSDNGGLEQLSGVQVTSQAPLRGGKGTEYDGGVRVPMIIKGRGIQQGALVSTPTIQTDLYPTLIELAGLNEVTNYVHDGISLASLVRDGVSSAELEAREAIFWHYPDYKARMQPSSYVRKGDWVLILYHEQEISPYGGKPTELYNLSTDIGQATNLITQFPGKAAELYADLSAHRQAAAAQMPTIDPAYVWDGPPTAITLPGRFEAEDYDYGGEGAGFHDVDADSGTDVYRTDAVDMEPAQDSGAGFCIKAASAGEWLNYQVDVASAGSFDIHLRVATGSTNRQVILTLDGDFLATVDIPDTGGDQSWTTVTAENIDLPAGHHVLRVAWGTQGGPSMNWIDVQEVEVNLPVLGVADGSFENPTNVEGSWGMCPSSWNDSASSQYEVGSAHFTEAADGNWSALMSTLGTIHQELGSVDAGDTLTVVFYGGRAKAGKNTDQGGVFSCNFIVGTSTNSVQADTTLQSNDTWKAYTNIWVATESGTLTLEFSNVSGKSWLDYISDVAVETPPPVLPDPPEGSFLFGGAEPAGVTIETVESVEYRLIYKDKLISTNGWLPVTPPFPDGWTNGSGSAILITDPHSSTQRFYRIEARTRPGD